jgi:hypothetical protein
MNWRQRLSSSPDFTPVVDRPASVRLESATTQPVRILGEACSTLAHGG